MVWHKCSQYSMTEKWGGGGRGDLLKGRFFRKEKIPEAEKKKEKKDGRGNQLLEKETNESLGPPPSLPPPAHTHNNTDTTLLLLNIKHNPHPGHFHPIILSWRSLHYINYSMHKQPSLAICNCRIALDSLYFRYSLCEVSISLAFLHRFLSSR
jgi:hypothetical protein